LGNHKVRKGKGGLIGAASTESPPGGKRIKRNIGKNKQINKIKRNIRKLK
jgi:hypothetical protein